MKRYLALTASLMISMTVANLPVQAQDSAPPPTRPYDHTAPELQSRQEEEPSEQPHEPAVLQWKLEPGQRLHQELIVTQKSRCRIQGLDVATGLKYLVVSSFIVEEVASDGSAVVRQRIEATRLLEADALARSVFADLLTKLKGTTFRLTLSPQMEILNFEADEDAFPIVAGGNPMEGQPLMMASLVDRDGWRELDQLTFFQPNRSLKTGERWQRPLTHSWGPLGSWKGQSLYRYDGESDGLDRVVYQLKLQHQPPTGTGGNLPFRPTSATFQHEKAGGVVYFDRRRGRVEQAEESFHVRGSMAIELLGQKMQVGLVEQQDFQLRIYENRLGR